MGVIVNGSSREKINVRVTFENGEQIKTTIDPTQNVSLDESIGTGLMTIFDVKGDEVWKGRIPLNASKPIIVKPEEKKVFYGSILLPGSFVLKANFQWLLVLLVILALVLIFWILSGKKW